uniref:GG12164 n=1 Tax=Drosophila erecta TaxID=7220 RepID=B3P893_DROER
MAVSNNRSISSAMSQMIIALAITIMMMTILALKFYWESRWLDVPAMRISTESQFDDANKMRSPAIDCCRHGHRHALLMARKPARIRICTGLAGMAWHRIGADQAKTDRATAKKPQLHLKLHSDNAATTADNSSAT